MDSSSIKEDDNLYSEDEENGTDEEPHKYKTKTAEPTIEGPYPENVKEKPCEEQNKALSG